MIPRVKKVGEPFYLDVDIGDEEKPGIEHERAIALAAEGRLWLGNGKLLAMGRIQGDLAEWMI